MTRIPRRRNQAAGTDAADALRDNDGMKAWEDLKAELEAPPHAVVSRRGRWRWEIQIIRGLMQWGPAGGSWFCWGSQARADRKAKRKLAAYRRTVESHDVRLGEDGTIDVMPNQDATKSGEQSKITVTVPSGVHPDDALSSKHMMIEINGTTIGFFDDPEFDVADGEVRSIRLTLYPGQFELKTADGETLSA